MQRQGVVGPGIYQMHFLTPSKGYIVAVWPGTGEPMFVGELSSSVLEHGKITLKFSSLPNTDYEYRSIDIDGRADISGEDGVIEGNIVVVRRNGKTEKNPVLFQNSLWVHSIGDASKTARKILESAEKKNDTR